MALPCPICIHESRLAIEQAMLNGRPKTEIARNFGFTYTNKRSGKELGDHKTIARHEPHMKGAVQAAAESREVKSGLAITNRLEHLNAQVEWVLEEARKGEDVLELVAGEYVTKLDGNNNPVKRFNYRLILSAVAQGRHNLALLADLSGAIPDGKDDEMAQLRERLSTPEGRRLLAAIDALDAQQDAGAARAD